MLRYIVLVSFLLVASASAGLLTKSQTLGELDIQDCEGSLAGVGYVFTVTSPNITGEVILKKGGVYHFTITFESYGTTATLKPLIYGVVNGIQIPWNGLGNDACTGLSGANRCPIKNELVYVYNGQVEILAAYPAVSLTFVWQLMGHDAATGKDVPQICFTMPAKVVA